MVRQITRNVAHKQRDTRYADYLKSVEAFHSEAPAINPYVVSRNLLDYTQAFVAEACGISKQALIRLEQGVPDKPIEAVTNYYLSTFARTNPNYDYLWFINGYELFQENTRQRNSKLFGAIPAGYVFDWRVHTLTQLLNNWTDCDGRPVGHMNVTECSKLLCINQSILDHWLKKPHRQQSVPKVFIEALRTNGYRRFDIEQVEKAYMNHRAYIQGGAPLADNMAKQQAEPSLKESILSELR